MIRILDQIVQHPKQKQLNRSSKVGASQAREKNIQKTASKIGKTNQSEATISALRQLILKMTIYLSASLYCQPSLESFIG